MSEHTPEPWRIGDGKTPFYAWAGQILAEHGDGEFILASCNQNYPQDAEANARRIVACVNECKGMPQKLLEEGKGPFQLLGETIRERDEARTMVKDLECVMTQACEQFLLANGSKPDESWIAAVIKARAYLATLD